MGAIVIGIGVAVAALGVVLGAIGFGSAETTSGSGLMTVGSTAFVGGLLMFALGFILRVLRDIAEKLDGAVHFEPYEEEAAPARATATAVAVEAASFATVAPGYPEPDYTAAKEASVAPAFPEPDELPAPAGDRGLPSWFRRKRPDTPAEEPGFEPEPALAEPADYEPLPPFRSTSPARREPPPPVDAYDEPPFEPRQPAEVLARAPRPREDFPRQETPREDLPPQPVAPPPFLQDTDLLADEPEPATEPVLVTPPPEPEVTVLKSGTIGGMAYKLYSDGSIEADLPDGTLRFASLQDLRDHVSGGGNRG
ncbi:hypothetical protein MWN33_13560 [Starkeya koreensis]|uniref:DUF308 domain-containing protein n=1 Tax=Ancylobacter koreensis TaxID=266121 RepID=A0ABT0DP59_9HYPH|nr:interferon alpha-inducible IFI6/IFI27 family protein [Ancylobacter koreensis]MCK0209058.1 hypothetical protein [Ancylobacter koreensis]